MKPSARAWPESRRLGRAVVLASASPRRAAILRQLGITFTQVLSRVPEPCRAHNDPARSCRKLACEKARAVSRNMPGALVIGCDTMVIYKGKQFGKPADAREAARMLRKLSGARHEVFSGIALARNSNILGSAIERTRVYFRELSDREIAWYIRTGEPFDKAGGYGIQGAAGVFVRRIEGCYYNVVGFPLHAFVKLVRKAA